MKKRSSNKRTKRSLASVVVETYTDFAENTSIHGVKYTVQKNVSIYERFLWVLMVLLGLAGSVFMVQLFWERFSSNPTRTSIKTAYAPTISLPFPAITICNINRIFDFKVEDFVKKLDLPANMTNSEAIKLFPQILAYTETSRYDYNTTTLEVLQDLLNKNDYGFGRAIYKISQNCKEMLVKCKWEGKDTECRKLFDTVLTPDGVCCSFNYKLGSGSVNYTFYYGIRMGLTVLLNPMLQKVQYSSLSSRGMKAIIHNPKSYPGAGNLEKILASGRETLLQIDGTRYICSEDVRNLTPKQRECVYNDEHSLSYFTRYTGENCDVECMTKSMYEKCGCVPYFFSFSDKPTCNATKIPCLVSFREEMQKKEEECDCPRQCEDVSYDILSTTTTFLRTPYYMSSFLSGVETTPDSILLHVYFTRQTQTVILRDAITSAVYLLSSFGGIFSLLLGCSFISGIEIIYYITIRLFVNLNRTNRIDTTQEPRDDKLWHDKKLRRVYKEAWDEPKTNGIYTVFIN